MSCQRTWLLLRRSGSLWAIARETLRQVPRGEPTRIQLSCGNVIVADEILGFESSLEEWPMPRAAEPFLKMEVRALGIWHQEPVLLLEPGAPPPTCLVAKRDMEIRSHGRET